MGCDPLSGRSLLNWADGCGWGVRGVVVGGDG
jgi:hypothetical protein